MDAKQPSQVSVCSVVMAGIQGSASETRQSAMEMHYCTVQYRTARWA